VARRPYARAGRARWPESKAGQRAEAGEAKVRAECASPPQTVPRRIATGRPRWLSATPTFWARAVPGRAVARQSRPDSSPAMAAQPPPLAAKPLPRPHRNRQQAARSNGRGQESAHWRQSGCLSQYFLSCAFLRIALHFSDEPRSRPMQMHPNRCELEPGQGGDLFARQLLELEENEHATVLARQSVEDAVDRLAGLASLELVNRCQMRRRNCVFDLKVPCAREPTPKPVLAAAFLRHAFRDPVEPSSHLGPPRSNSGWASQRANTAAITPSLVLDARSESPRI